MGAFNWIELLAKCPACGAESSLRAQTHIASSFDGDRTGRFHDRTYRLGEAMAWFPDSDSRNSAWADASDPGHRPAVHEACYGECSSCRGDLCVVLEFASLAPTRVVSLTREAEWPADYLR